MAEEDKQPGSVLFICNLNAIRSPMAEGLVKAFYPGRIFTQSAGVTPGDPDPFAAEVMIEQGVDISGHEPRGLDDLDDITSYDLIIALTPEARQEAEEATRSAATEVEYWDVVDPLATPTGGSRERRLVAYRELRDQLKRLIEKRFGRAARRVG